MELLIKDKQRKSAASQSKELAQQFSTDKLIEHLGISYTTARRYKRGHSVMRKAEYSYLTIILQKRSMPKNWPLNITFEPDDRLHLSKYSLSWGQLEHFSWICERWGESLHRANVLSDYVDDIIESMTEVQRAQTLELRRLMIQCVSEGKPYDIFAKEA